MSSLVGALRRRILTPPLAEVSFAARRFPVEPSPATRRLEVIPRAVICGFEWGVEVSDLREIEERISLIDPEHVGFAYEGVTMAFTVRDAMGRGRRTRELLLGPAAPHIFLTYIGIGFAMARLPRPTWRKVLPDLPDSAYHPTMSWLAVDGYGFDRAFFETERWVGRQERSAAYPWAGRPDYFHRAVDQGIGRALWFIHGAGVDGVDAAVRAFAADRRPDLWSGVGLAATFAGGAPPDALTRLRRHAGELWPHLAQGSVFAAKARAYSGFVPAHTEGAVAALTGLALPAAVALADDSTVVFRPDADEPPAYEQWRARVRGQLASRSALPTS
ncbi:DUF1702 family protein [Micromonospora sp. NPDC051543]|uniref:DUF1702 family protein n=1 Tax=Micromonospora sp. NPDC051543 TaxID=3364287 RepID=UPI0037957F66